MTKPADIYFHPRPQSGHGLHTQESGYDGYSSNMEHKFSDNYRENSFPVADKGSFVIPIPKGELDDYEHPKKPGKIWSPPLIFEDPAAAPKAESHHVTLEKGFLKPSTVAVAQKNLPPRATKIALPENNPEEEVAKVSEARTTTISKEEPDKEVVEGDGCIIDTNMDTRGTPEKKGPSLVTGERMSSEHHKKRAAGKKRKVYLLCLLLFMRAPASEGSPAGARPAADQKFKCFVCTDKDRCPNLTHIFINEDVHPVYNREPNSTIPSCCGFAPTNNMTTVCQNQSDIIIIYPEGVRNVEAEDDKQLTISPNCTYEETITCHHARYEWIAAPVALFFIAAVAVLVIYLCRRKK